MKLNCDGWTFKTKPRVCLVIIKRSTSLGSTHHDRLLTGSAEQCAVLELETPEPADTVSIQMISGSPASSWDRLCLETMLGQSWKEIKSSQISCLVAAISIYGRQFLMRNRWERKTGGRGRGETLDVCSMITGTEAKASLLSWLLLMPGGLLTESS